MGEPIERTAPTDHAPPTRAEGAPDRDRLTCPLCGYSLRGLAEPRCPECGYAFEWDGLLDAERTRHPYLFEHHPRRNVWSFFRTLFGGLRPGRFWRTLHPAQPSSVRRLMLYWFLTALLAIIAMALDFGRHAYLLNDNFAAQRATTVRQLAARASAPEAVAIVQRFGSIQAAAEQIHPTATSFAFWNKARQTYVQQVTGQRRTFRPWGTPPPLTIGLHAASLYATWPWLTIGALLVFQSSMRRANVRAVHILRAVVYSCDAAWLLIGIVVIVVPPAIEISLPYVVWNWGLKPAGHALAVAAILFAAFTAWRLAAAYRSYLRFDHPLATAAAAQVIVILLVLVFLSYAQ